MKKRLICCLASVWAAGSLQAQDSFPKTVPSLYMREELPEAYKDYLVFSSSPDKQYGLISIRRSLLDDPNKENRVFLVALKPFKILREIPLLGSDLERGHSSHDEVWAPSSSAVMLIEGTKWGPASVFVVSIQGRQASRPVELTSKIRRIVLPDFEKSKAKRYNDYYKFILDQGHFTGLIGQKTEIKDKWSFNEHGQAVIACTCTNDPKGLEGQPWSVRFDGVWNIAQGKFTHKSFVRLNESNGFED